MTRKDGLRSDAEEWGNVNSREDSAGINFEQDEIGGGGIIISYEEGTGAMTSEILFIGGGAH